MTDRLWQCGDCLERISYDDMHTVIIYGRYVALCKVCKRLLVAEIEKITNHVRDLIEIHIETNAGGYSDARVKDLENIKNIIQDTRVKFIISQNQDDYIDSLLERYSAGFWRPQWGDDGFEMRYHRVARSRPHRTAEKFVRR